MVGPALPSMIAELAPGFAEGRRGQRRDAREARASAGRPALLQRAREWRRAGDRPGRRLPARALREPRGRIGRTSRPPGPRALARLRERRTPVRDGDLRGGRPAAGARARAALHRPRRRRRGRDGDRRRPAGGRAGQRGELAFDVAGRLLVTGSVMCRTPRSRRIRSRSPARCCATRPRARSRPRIPIPRARCCAWACNPFALAVHPVSGDLYAADNGPTEDDELVYLVPGRNYGWGYEGEGLGVQEGFTIRRWAEVIVPTALAFHPGNGGFEEHAGELFLVPTSVKTCAASCCSARTPPTSTRSSRSCAARRWRTPTSRSTCWSRRTGRCTCRPSRRSCGCSRSEVSTRAKAGPRRAIALLPSHTHGLRVLARSRARGSDGPQREPRRAFGSSSPWAPPRTPTLPDP